VENTPVEPLTAEVVETGERGEREVVFDAPVEEHFDALGVMPLPPYIHRRLEDPERYQTVYSHTLGSAAAPTAGLHFTPDLLLALREQGVGLAFVTLHVGLDTFRPVTEATLEAHAIHSEWCSLSPEVAAQINRTKVMGGRVVAVGTTSVRVLKRRRGTDCSKRRTPPVPGGRFRPTRGSLGCILHRGFSFAWWIRSSPTSTCPKARCWRGDGFRGRRPHPPRLRRSHRAAVSLLLVWGCDVDRVNFTQRRQGAKER
jgi:S-adenosylmethionine:tRNA ribosyltransferase-isomerase